MGRFLPMRRLRSGVRLQEEFRTINFTEGNQVNKGDLLVKIVDDELQAQLKKLTLQEKLSKEDVQRKTKLRELDAISQEEFDQGQNQLLVIQADIQLVKAQIEKTEINAPFDGLIGLRYVSPGGYLVIFNTHYPLT